MTLEDGNGKAGIREVQSAIIASEERLKDHFGGELRDLEKRLRSVERWAYALPLTLVVAMGSIVANVIIVMQGVP